MYLSPRWSLGAGVMAPLLVGILVAVGALIASQAEGESRSAGERHESLGPRTVPDSSAPALAEARDQAAATPVEGGHREVGIEARLRPLLAQPRLRAGVFGYDLNSQAYFTIAGDESFAAASLIKVPIAVALLAAVDCGEIALDESLALRSEDVATGSGSLQYLPLGTRVTVGRLGELMIRRSDNTATNMILARLGGSDELNALFSSWGLGQTRIRNPLPDLAGTNRTSPRDLVGLLRRSLEEGILSGPSRSRLLGWMSRSHVRSMIPASAGRGAYVANKTGDIPEALGDAAYVLRSGKSRYLLAVQVERPRNSANAKTLIRSVSGAVWEELTGTPSPLTTAGHGRSGRGRVPHSVGRPPSRTRTRAS